jgi:1-acyl-sn-glycerol-3-phosphate acyltransferase
MTRTNRADGLNLWNIVLSVIARRMVRVVLFATCRVHREFLEQLPRRAPFIVASNHISHFDPPILGAWHRRYIDWLAMEELFSGRAATWLLKSLCAIPLRRVTSESTGRGAVDLTPIRDGLSRLRKGRVLGIFPEGGIRAGASSVLEGAPMWPGVATIAILSQLPIFPCVILGTDRLYAGRSWIPFRRVHLYILSGKAITVPPDLPKDEAKQYVIEKLGSAFQQLLTEAVRRWQLRPDDLPTSPQARKRPDYLSPERSSERQNDPIC